MEKGTFDVDVFFRPLAGFDDASSFKVNRESSSAGLPGQFIPLVLPNYGRKV